LSNLKSDSNKNLSQKDFETLADFRYALRQFLRMSEMAAYAAGLTPQQHMGLLAIRGYPGPGQFTMGELAERLQLRHQSAVMLTDRLSALDLVERQQPTQAEDRRQVYLVLTQKGKAVIEKMTAAHREELCRLQPVIDQLCENLRGTSRESSPTS
jgi:DNA-binding MarR family transcriptional regulator